MKIRVILLALVVTLTLLGIAFAVQSQSVVPAGTQQWEYLVARPVGITGNVLRPQIDTGVVMNDEGVNFNGSVYLWLNGVGEQGWELTQLVDGYYFFKRPKPQ